MNNHSLYSKFKITYDDYKYYNTHFVEDQYLRVPEYTIVNRLKFIHKMCANHHSILSDENILKIIKNVKNDLVFNRRLLLAIRSLFIGIILFLFSKYETKNWC